MDYNSTQIVFQYSLSQNVDDLLTMIKITPILIDISLDFGRTEVTTEDIEKVIEELGKCKLERITKLNLNFQANKFDETTLSKLVSFVSRCSNLEDITLSFIDTQIGPVGTQILEQGISKCTKLKKLNLDISNYFYQKKNYSSIPGNEMIFSLQIMKCPNLQNLQLKTRHNFVGEKGLYTLAEGLSQCQQLKELYMDLSGTRIQVDSILHLVKEISKCQMISYLTFFFRWIGNFFDDKLEELSLNIRKRYKRMVLFKIIV